MCGYVTPPNRGNAHSDVYVLATGCHLREEFEWLLGETGWGDVMSSAVLESRPRIHVQVVFVNVEELKGGGWGGAEGLLVRPIFLGGQVCPRTGANPVSSSRIPGAASLEGYLL